MSWFFLLSIAFLSRCSTFLAFPSSSCLHCIFDFYPHSFMNWPLRSYLQRYWPCHTLPGLTGLLLKSGWRPSWPYCILHYCKMIIMGKMPRSATNSIDCWTPLDISCSGYWVPEWLSVMKWILGNNFLSSPV
jgi:hypothetical protein